MQREGKVEPENKNAYEGWSSATIIEMARNLFTSFLGLELLRMASWRLESRKDQNAERM
jgi:hypothetical protein